MNTAMEPLTTPSQAPNDQLSHEQALGRRRSSHRTPWGLFIGLLLILAIIVAGAYYTLNERLAPQSVHIEVTP